MRLLVQHVRMWARPPAIVQCIILWLALGSAHCFTQTRGVSSQRTLTPAACSRGASLRAKTQATTATNIVLRRASEVTALPSEPAVATVAQFVCCCHYHLRLRLCSSEVVAWIGNRMMRWGRHGRPEETRTRQDKRASGQAPNIVSAPHSLLKRQKS